MPINIHPRNGFLKPAEDMGFGLEFRKSSTKQHSSSKTAKESSVLPHSKQSWKDAEKLKSKSDLKQKGKLDAEGKIQNSETVRRRATERDELVKHMSSAGFNNPLLGCILIGMAQLHNKHSDFTLQSDVSPIY